MWLCLNDAFLSIVSKECARDELLVRARRPGDIEKIFPGAKVTKNVHADYLFRAIVKRDAIARALEGEVRRITYANFKDSVADKRLHDAYLGVWTRMSTLQPVPPFGRTGMGFFHHEGPAPKKPRRRGKRGGRGRKKKLSRAGQ